MEGTYDVMLGSQKMGKVSVQKQGLYWQFDCRCNLCDEVMYDLVIQIGNTKVSLGLLTPRFDCFSLITKQPMKRMEQGRPSFLLQPRHIQMKGNFVPVNPDEPFRYLCRLESAYLATKSGKIGVVIDGEK